MVFPCLPWWRAGAGARCGVRACNAATLGATLPSSFAQRSFICFRLFSFICFHLFTLESHGMAEPVDGTQDEVAADTAEPPAGEVPDEPEEDSAEIEGEDERADRIAAEVLALRLNQLPWLAIKNMLGARRCVSIVIYIVPPTCLTHVLQTNVYKSCTFLILNDLYGFTSDWFF